jgi:hypothetical protein
MDDMEKTTVRGERILPVLSAIGVGVMVLGLIGTVNSAPIGYVLLIVGVVMLVGGLLQRSIERSRSQDSRRP